MSSADFPDALHISRISDALWSGTPSGSAVVLVGAGFSRNAVPVRGTAKVMPGWNDIYRTMVDQLYPMPTGHPAITPAANPASKAYAHRDWLMMQAGSTSAYLRVAEEYEAQFGRPDLDKLILKNVPDRQFVPGDLHHMLVQLPWADIMTTNWDTLLERAGEDAEERVYDVLRTVEEMSERRAPRIIKLHGSFPSHRPFIFTEEDFRTYANRFSPFVNLAQQLAMENTLVLLGFSGDDPNFLFWSGWVRDRLGPRAPTVYLVGVLNLSASKRKMLESRHIQPVDLAAIPEFAGWPDAHRMANANQWFLERLRAVEPYPTKRWPRAAAGFVPPLKFVTAPPDPNAPSDKPVFSAQPSGAERVARLVPHWRHNRQIYPGWVVAPLDTCDMLWREIDTSLGDVVEGLRALSVEDRLDALFEMNWQLETALVPLILTVDDIIADLLGELVERYEELPAEQADQVRALALALVRHAREENQPDLFARWSQWLEPRIVGDDAARDRLIYEKCLRHRAEFEIDALEALIDAWTVSSDQFWLLRKAGLLADLGRSSEAADLSHQAFTEIRAHTDRGANDIASWSRESFAMLFRTSVLHMKFDRWIETQPARERFDMRQDELLARGCPGKRDFFEIMDQLKQPPPRLKPEVEVWRRFDIGSQNRTFRLAAIDPRVDRLRAYQALRFLEECGLPARVGSAGVSVSILAHASRWLIDVAPTRAIDAFLQISENPSAQEFDEFLSRSAIARISTDEAERLIDRIARLAAAVRARVGTAGNDDRFWIDRFRSMVEIASRIVMRAPSRAAKLLKLALELHADVRFRTRFALADELNRLVPRVLDAASPGDRDAMLLAIFEQPVPDAADGKSEVYDPAATVRTDLRVASRADAWDSVIDAALVATEDPAKRRFAVERLQMLKDMGLLGPGQFTRFTTALWSVRSARSLPSGTSYYPHAFIALDPPADVDIQAVVATILFDGGPLTDDNVRGAALSYGLSSKAVVLSEAQLLTEIERLHAFVANHKPEPSHPDFFGDHRGQLIFHTSLIFARLADRAVDHAAALPAITALLACDHYPLRVVAAIPALVRLGLMDPGEALDRLQALFQEQGTLTSQLVGIIIGALGDVDAVAPELEAVLWQRLALAIATLQPTCVHRLLQFAAHVMRASPSRIPISCDAMLSLGLSLILAETDGARLTDQTRFDPFLVRYMGAMLATAMDGQNRGEIAMRSAWNAAIDSDPLPDTRYAREVARRPVSVDED